MINGNLSTEELLALQTTAGLLGVNVQDLINQLPSGRNLLPLISPADSTQISHDASSATEEKSECHATRAVDGASISQGDYTSELLNLDVIHECDQWPIDANDFTGCPAEDLEDTHLDLPLEDNATDNSAMDMKTDDDESFGFLGKVLPGGDRVAHSVASGLGSDWTNVFPTRSQDVPIRPSHDSSSSTKRKLRAIEPKKGKELKVEPAQLSSPKRTSPDQPRKRQRYDEKRRSETLVTRQNKSCMRCRLQRNRCHADPTDPTGPCLPCREKVSRIGKMPCLRQIITECILFRTGLDFEPFYNVHPLVGPAYGDFQLPREWIGAPSRILHLSQDRNLDWGLDKESLPRVEVEFRAFVPPANDNSKDIKGNPMYLLPWAIADPRAVVRNLNHYIEQTQDLYIKSNLEQSEPLVWNVMHMAYRTTVLPVPNTLLKNAFRLWVGTRMIEGTWQCTGDGDLMRQIPPSPFDPERIPPPSYLDYQYASLMIQNVLMPLREKVLRDFQALFTSRTPEDWFVTFMVSFILLHNYERQMQFQHKFSSKRQMKVIYADKVLMRAINAGAKTILWHFHYCCKGQHPFRPDFDWSSPKTQRMARLNDEQIDFMKDYHGLVVRNAEMLQSAHASHEYHAKYWYTSQLFVPDWQPPQTLEHPPSSTTKVG